MVSLRFFLGSDSAHMRVYCSLYAEKGVRLCARFGYVAACEVEWTGTRIATGLTWEANRYLVALIGWRWSAMGLVILAKWVFGWRILRIRWIWRVLLSFQTVLNMFMHDEAYYWDGRLRYWGILLNLPLMLLRLKGKRFCVQLFDMRILANSSFGGVFLNFYQIVRIISK